MNKKYILTLLILAVFSFVFTYVWMKPADKLNDVIAKFMYKTVEYPKNIETIIGDTAIISQDSCFTIIHNIDSLGCTKCKLHIEMWDYLMNEINQISAIPVKLVFLSSNDNKTQLLAAFNGFDRYPVINTRTLTTNFLSELPDTPPVNTILLDQSNRIISIGNPLTNKKIKTNYYNLILNNRKRHD